MINKLLDSLQSGLKANHSSTTALLKYVDDSSRTADLECSSILTLLDFYKAFDSIDHELLLIKLSKNFNFFRPLFQCLERICGCYGCDYPLFNIQV
jgi:hypothetical protein